MPFIKSSEFLYEIATGETEWGGRGEEGEGEREQQINGVREGALVRKGNGVC
jgi:hypothetical protein